MTSTLKWARICPLWRGSLQERETLIGILIVRIVGRGIR